MFSAFEAKCIQAFLQAACPTAIAVYTRNDGRKYALQYMNFLKSTHLDKEREIALKTIKK